MKEFIENHVIITAIVVFVIVVMMHIVVALFFCEKRSKNKGIYKQEKNRSSDFLKKINNDKAKGGSHE